MLNSGFKAAKVRNDPKKIRKKNHDLISVRIKRFMKELNLKIYNELNETCKKKSEERPRSG